jgi:hypothetical protein
VRRAWIWKKKKILGFEDSRWHCWVEFYINMERIGDRRGCRDGRVEEMMEIEGYLIYAYTGKFANSSY